MESGNERSLKRQEYRLIGTNGVLMVYIISDPSILENIITQPHGNSKQNTIPYVRVTGSCRDAIAQASTSQTPMQIWKSHITDLPNPTDPEFASEGQLLPSLNTIANVSTQRNKHEIEELFTFLVSDRNKIVQENSIRKSGVRLIVASEHQLTMLKKAIDLGVVQGYDTTFNIGRFYCSILSYKQLWYDDESLAIGAMMIHSSKEEHDHRWFFMNLSVLGISISRIGTDAELAIVNGLKFAYPAVMMVICWRHFIDNLKRKMIQLEITEKWRDKVITLFTGQADIAGLLDSISRTHLIKQWECVKSKLNQLIHMEESCKQFIRYIEEHKLNQIEQYMMKPVRQQFGIQGPYYSNNAESVNHILKSMLPRNTMSIHEFLEFMATEVSIFEKEYFLARLGYG